MASWSKDELDRINAEICFTVGVTLPDGTAPKTVNLWSVPVDDRIIIRSFNGAEGKRFGLILEIRKGKIYSSGVTKNATFAVVDHDDEETNLAVDHSFVENYSDSNYSVTMSSEPARQNTFEVILED